MAESRNMPVWIALLAAALAAMVLAGISTAAGQAFTPDSVVYLQGARNIAAGQGYAACDAHGTLQPVLHWPPLYPALLALGEWTGLGAEAAARWLNVLAHGALALLAGLAVWRGVNRTSAGVLVALLCAFSPTLLRLNAHLWSEPLFLCLGIACALSLQAWLSRGRAGWFAVAALLAGLACLQRYAGLAFVAAGGAAIVVALRSTRRPWPATLGLATAWTAAAMVLPVAWMARNFSVAGRTGTRQWLLEGPTIEHVKAAGYALATWFGPNVVAPVKIGFAAIALALLCALCLGAVRTLRREHNLPVLLCLSFGAGYALLLGATIVLFDNGTPLDERLTSPLLLCALVGGGLASGIMPEHRGAALRTALAVLLLSYIARGVATTQDAVDDSHYRAATWRDSGLVAAARQAGPGPLASNRPLVLLANVDSPCAQWPEESVTELLDPKGAKPFPDVAAARAELLTRLRRENGRLLMILADPEPFAREHNLRIEARFEGGAVFAP